MSRCAKVLFTWLFVVSPVLLWAQGSKKELENKRKQIQKEIRETEQLIADTRKSKKLSIGQLKMLNRKLGERKKLIANIQQEVGMLNTSIQGKDERVKALQGNLELLKETYARMVRRAYMNRKQQSVMLLVLSSNDIHQATRRLYYLKKYNAYLREQANMIRSTQDELNDNIAVLKTDLSNKNQLLGSEEREKKALNIEKTEQEKAVSELKKKENALRKDLARKQADAKKVNAAIQSIIEREIALERERALAKAKAEKAKSPGTAAKAPGKTAEPESSEIRVTPETRAMSGKFEANKGSLPWPVEKGVIQEGFGAHAHPVLKNIVTFNNGIDISTNLNAGVRTIFDGEVSGVISIPGANQAIIIKHGEYLTVYGNLDKVHVKRGDKVKARQVIGTAAAGDIENRGETHLEIWKGRNKLNPAEWIARF